jgi:hypothetical protein
MMYAAGPAGAAEGAASRQRRRWSFDRRMGRSGPRRLKSRHRKRDVGLRRRLVPTAVRVHPGAVRAGEAPRGLRGFPRSLRRLQPLRPANLQMLLNARVAGASALHQALLLLRLPLQLVLIGWAWRTSRREAPSALWNPAGEAIVSGFREIRNKIDPGTATPCNATSSPGWG